jgi:phosphoglycolate phosphatase-like HAD superfamily hydrolase
MIKAIIFDFDGVLVESMHIKTVAFARLFEREGAEVVRNVVTYHTANGGVSRFDKFRHIYRKFLQRDLTDEVFSSLCEQFSGLVQDEVVKASFVPGAHEFLTTSSATMPCFVASATPLDELQQIIRLRGMEPYFQEIFGAPLTKSAAVQTILQRHNCAPEHAVFIGDALSDWEAARDTGVHFVARVAPDNSLFDNIACCKIPDLTHMPDLIRTL